MRFVADLSPKKTCSETNKAATEDTQSAGFDGYCMVSEFPGLGFCGGFFQGQVVYNPEMCLEPQTTIYNGCLVKQTFSI